MIPAGMESKRYHNKFDDADYDYDDDDDFDEEEGFVFDFNSKKISEPEKSNNVKFEIKQNEEITEECTSMQYEVNNNYYCDESEYVLDDLKYAILNQNLNLVKELMEKYNLDVNCSLKSNWIPIMYAVSCGSYELTEYFIEKGADVNFNEDSFNVLMCACGCVDPSASERNLAKIIDLLISKGADISQCDKYYQTPLMYVCRAGNTTLIECLVKYEIDLNSKDDNDWTSLAHACSKGHYKCVHKLLRLGADPLISSIDYLYPHDIAQNNGYNDIKELIQNFLKVQKIENLKSQKKVAEFFENDKEDDLLNDCSYNKQREAKDDLECFLNAIKMPHMLKVFKQKEVSMKTLLNFGEQDLKNVGVFDDYVRQLIVSEVKKFHHKNWLSSSLVPVKFDAPPNCNEAIAIISNISRHMDFINENIKYLIREGVEENKEFFADPYLSSIFYTEIKNSLWNCNNLLGTVDSMHNKVKREVKDFQAEPIDLVKPSSPKRWYKDPIKVTAIATFAISGLFMVKTKFFS